MGRRPEEAGQKVVPSWKWALLPEAAYRAAAEVPISSLTACFPHSAPLLNRVPTLRPGAKDE